MLWAILAIGVALRVLGLGDKNLWLDESASWLETTRSLPDLVRWTARDVHPPGYYLLLKAWALAFGDSAVALRALSVVASVAAIGLAYLFAARIVGRGLALATAAWFAVSPHALYYAQEARMYAVVTALVLGACLAYHRWLDTASRRALFAYSACALGALYCHYFVALVLVAVWLHLSFVVRPRVWRRWLIAHAILAILYLPWLPVEVAQIARGQSWRPPVAWSALPSHVAELARALVFGLPELRAIGGATASIATLVLGVGIGVLVRDMARTRERDTALCLLLLGVPVGLASAVVPLTGELVLARYLPFAMPLLVLAAARGWALLAPRAGIAAICIGALAVVPSTRTYLASPAKDTDVRPTAAYLAAHASPGDRTCVAPGYAAMPLAFAFRGGSWVELASDAAVTVAIATRPCRWLVVDYRWAGRLALQTARLVRIPVASGPRPTMLYDLSAK